ncbi:MAG: HAD family phosphatase [Pirellulales bacterium]|nr:HAD family phosphatase [Pirellulales bacterium]
MNDATPRFFYFDMGRVLVDFDVDRMLRQMGEVAGVPPERVRKAIFDTGLQQRLELGDVSGEEFLDTFRRETGSQPDPAALERAASDIFELKLSMLPVVAQFRAAGHRMGVLSNTCQSHWEHCRRRYRILGSLFDVAAMSFDIHRMKPDREIFLAAAELADEPPEAIFFVDDTPGHVEGARAAGFDAVVYTTTPQLVADLRRRGARFNY